MRAPVRVFEWCNGALVERGGHASLAEAQADLPHGAYTTLRTYGGQRFLRLEAHARRLSESARAPLPQAWLAQALVAGLRATRLPESRCRVTWAPPRLFVAVEAFTPPPQELRENGVACLSVDLHRNDPAAKDTRFIETARAAYQSLPEGVHEGLLLGEAGEILEGLSSNFLALLDGTLRTAVEGALAGITRGLLLEAAAGLVPIVERPVRLSDLPRLDEALLTSTSRGVLSVVSIDGCRIGDGRPGPLGHELCRRLEALVERTAQPP